MLEVKIETGGAAFCDEMTGEENPVAKSYECKRILYDICCKLAKGYTKDSIMDINGNKVGEWSLT